LNRKKKLKILDDLILEELAIWRVPGVAIAIVQNGQVILLKGYGLRDVQNKLPTTPETLFPIGSITKSFTVASLGVLMRQGKLDWDRPVREYLPNFRLYDPIASEHATLRDLVLHCTGLPRHDRMHYKSPLSRDELYQRLRYLEPNKEFRSTFQYNNLMYMVLGYLSGEVTGTTWEEQVRKNIFAPLSMNDSNFCVRDSQKSPDFALPYEKDDEENVRHIQFWVNNTIGPAGSINSNVEDMVQYLPIQLNKGKYKDQQVLAEADVIEMQTPQITIPGLHRFEQTGHYQYGMGFFITTYRGHKLVEHGGNTDGFTGLLTFMPHDNIGMVVLSNLGSTRLPEVLAYKIYDFLLDLEHIPWSTRFKQSEIEKKEAEEKAKNSLCAKPGTTPSHDLQDYTGEYEHPAYGTLEIELNNDTLKMSFHSLTSYLKHFHYDIFETSAGKLSRLENFKIMFHTNLNGDIDSLSIPFEPLVTGIIFKRVPGRTTSEA
jgi:CubicO group peptidase (beta-lactamase class C family)